MHGSLTDFYTDAPIQRTALETWPKDFDPYWIDYYQTKPLTKEVQECERCSVRRACQPARYAKASCAENEIKHANGYTGQQDAQSLILDALRTHGPLTLHELIVHTGRTYSTVRNRLFYMLRDGLITTVNERKKTFGGAQPAHVYRLI